MLSKSPPVLCAAAEHMARLQAEADAQDKRRRLAVAQEQLAEYAMQKETDARSLLQDAQEMEAQLKKFLEAAAASTSGTIITPLSLTLPDLLTLSVPFRPLSRALSLQTGTSASPQVSCRSPYPLPLNLSTCHAKSSCLSSSPSVSAITPHASGHRKLFSLSDSGGSAAGIPSHSPALSTRC